MPQKLDPDYFYRRDLPICLGDDVCYEGVTVLPRRSSYEFDIAPKGDANIDLLLVTSCAREESFEKTASGWWIFQKKNRFKYFYNPLEGLEDDGDCSLTISTFEKDKGRHAWSRIVFEHPKYALPATLYCNGQVIKANGVSICQSKVGLRQQIKFPERVMIEADKGCPMPVKGSSSAYEWGMGDRECGYTIRGESGKLHSLLTLGYSGVLVRESK